MFEQSSDKIAVQIKKAAQIKQNIVENDPFEKGQRKVLNFGHSFGHAFETLALRREIPFLHGEAVAAGILPALWLSQEIQKLPQQYLADYLKKYKQLFQPFRLGQEDIGAVLEIMQHDKKNKAGKYMFVLIESFAKPKYDIAIESEMLKSCLTWYTKLF